MVSALSRSTDGQVAYNRPWRDSVASGLEAYGYTAAAERFRSCGRHVVAVKTCSQDINHSSHPIFESCGLRICPICASVASDRLVKAYTAAIERIMSERTRPGYRLRHIVLTTNIHPQDKHAKARYLAARRQIVETILDCLCPRRDSELLSAWRTRRRAKLRIIGLLVSDEFGEDGGHYHAHGLYYGPFITQSELSSAWCARTGFPIVYITQRQDKPVGDVLGETLKYVTKFAVDGQAVNQNLLVSIHGILAGQRRVRSYGLFFDLPPLSRLEPEPELCSTCFSQLENRGVDDYLVSANDYVQKRRYDATQPAPSPDLLCTLATTALRAREDIMFTARRLWRQVWVGLNWSKDGEIPEPMEYAIGESEADSVPAPP